MIAQRGQKWEITLDYYIRLFYTRGGNLAEHVGLEPLRPNNS